MQRKVLRYNYDVKNFFDSLKSGASLNVRVRPRSSQTKIKGFLADGTLKLDIAAPAENNKANLELIRFLKEDCEIPNIEIVRGQTNTKKVIRINQE